MCKSVFASQEEQRKEIFTKIYTEMINRQINRDTAQIKKDKQNIAVSR